MTARCTLWIIGAAIAGAMLATSASIQAESEPAGSERLQASLAPHSVARMWNEALLNAIRNDYARPTVHARNLFHAAIAMYDAWAAFDDTATPYLLGSTVGGFACPFDGMDTPADVRAAREEAIGYAMYRIIRERVPGFAGSAQDTCLHQCAARLTRP